MSYPLQDLRTGISFPKKRPSSQFLFYCIPKDAKMELFGTDHCRLEYEQQEPIRS